MLITLRLTGMDRIYIDFGSYLAGPSDWSGVRVWDVFDFCSSLLFAPDAASRTVQITSVTCSYSSDLSVRELI
jgi:hypothetical protein